MAKKNELTRKQRIFVAEYLVDFNGTQAVIRAGYNPNPRTAEVQAFRLLRTDKIRAEVQRLQDERLKARGITADYILKSLHEVAEYCKVPRPRYNRNGDVIGESLDASGANKALELLGKHLSLFTDNLNVRKIKSLEDLTDEEAIAIAKKIKEAD